MSRAIEAVIFDLAGVVIVPGWELFAHDSSGSPVPHDELVVSLIAGYDDPDHPLCRWERGEIPFVGIGPEMLGRNVTSHIDWPTLRMDVVPLQPVEPIVAAASVMRRSGYKTCLLSNTSLEFKRLIDSQLPVDELFDVFVSSYTVGVRKPDPAIYLHACEQLGIKPHQAVFLDDNPICVEGARAVGMQTILVGDPRTAAFDLVDLLG